MKLMYAPASPFARKVRASAIELGLGDAIELVLTMVAPGSPNEAYARNYNPLRKIPALELEDSTVLYDSTVICEYLDAPADGGGIIPSGDSPGSLAYTGVNLALALLLLLGLALTGGALLWDAKRRKTAVSITG